MKNKIIEERRRNVYMILAGFFLGSMSMLNVLGITKFIQFGPLALTVGVLPYPITFLCTDLISELYGKKRASIVVWVGLLLNLFILFVVWLGNLLPGVPLDQQPPWQVLNLAEPITLPNGEVAEGRVELFHILYANTASIVFGSMVAYLTAQFCDVHLFHFFKRLTKGKHFWLRNNGSTMLSQLVDTVAVISITFGAAYFAGEMTIKTLLYLIGSSYSFKLLVALIDTIPAYFLVHFLSKYLHVEAEKEHSF